MNTIETVQRIIDGAYFPPNVPRPEVAAHSERENVALLTTTVGDGTPQNHHVLCVPLTIVGETDVEMASVMQCALNAYTQAYTEGPKA